MIDDWSEIKMNENEELVVKKRALKKTIKKDSLEFWSLGLTCVCLLTLTKSIKEFKGLMNQSEDIKNYALESTSKKDREQTISDIINSGYVSILNTSMSIENKFYFQDQYLYNQENEIVTLENYSDPVCFYHCNLDYETLRNICLKESNTKEISLNFSSIDNKCIEYLPESLEGLSLSYCFYLSDLKNLPIQCPNIKILYLDSLTSVKDYSFLAEFENIEEVSISDSAYITEDLIQYLDSRGIKHNLTEVDIENNRITSEIIEKIIKPDMSDKEKIHKICKYVLENVEYDINQTSDSNNRPLRCVLEDGKGVCVSYAYLTNVLLKKANINTWILTNKDHVWNMVNVDGKYYYIDTTGMDNFSSFNNFLLDVFNISFCYMGDTENVTITSMSKLQSSDVVIPTDLLEDVLSGQDEKNIFEKYGETIELSIIILVFVIKGILSCFTPFLLFSLKDIIPIIIHDYKKIRDEEIVLVKK